MAIAPLLPTVSTTKERASHFRGIWIPARSRIYKRSPAAQICWSFTPLCLIHQVLQKFFIRYILRRARLAKRLKQLTQNSYCSATLLQQSRNSSRQLSAPLLPLIAARSHSHATACISPPAARQPIPLRSQERIEVAVFNSSFKSVQRVAVFTDIL